MSAYRSYITQLASIARPLARRHLLCPVVAAAALDRVQHALALALAGRVAALHVSVRRSHLANRAQGEPFSCHQLVDQSWLNQTPSQPERTAACGSAQAETTDIHSTLTLLLSRSAAKLALPSSCVTPPLARAFSRLCGANSALVGTQIIV